MTQEGAEPDGILLDVSDIELRHLDELDGTVLQQALETVLTMSEQPSQTLAGFNARVRRTTETTATARQPGSGPPGRGAGSPDREAR
ncbi:hypothetical protein [Spirillospora sp. NPDC047279]|uniref:hypothetical protein n=1 Tax=Spirillospora sp. NPDC047279 TaxID=3155478 RepID=UPI00340F8963